ncbi:sortase [Streptomyces sp. GMY02]|uniref:sortase domain-containing protein n=1 Tax=Streptomyces sp. GMY02 TaxID=1333528 RepID=UPI001C2C5BB2|nr:sortase [Streptomyces sp. GMY02]QXE36086.1 sortase [Streptomyces sp. GMY02]
MTRIPERAREARASLRARRARGTRTSAANGTVKVLFAASVLCAVAAVLLHLFPQRAAPPVDAAEPRLIKVTDPPTAPVRLRIPVLGLAVDVLPLGVDDKGSLNPPGFRDAMKVGWYALGPRPGDIGPAVLVGHRDAPANPGSVAARNGRDTIKNAAFAKLGRLRPGDLVETEQGDGRRLPFRVTSVSTYPTKSFPTKLVYGPVPNSQLRLITCGGVINAQGHWDSNVVVSAVASR